MDIRGLYMLNSSEYTEEKIQEALEILYTSRKNEFRELSRAFLGEKKLNETSNWREFVLNFSLDVADSFKTWTDQKPPSATSPQKALTILRQVGNGKTSMNKLTQILNISYDLAMEFKEIYRRLK